MRRENKNRIEFGNGVAWQRVSGLDPAMGQWVEMPARYTPNVTEDDLIHDSALRRLNQAEVDAAEMRFALPLIRMGGTPKSRLVEALCDADLALLGALEAMSQAAPNARDYTPDGYLQAMEEHHDRMCRVRTVLDEQKQLITKIDEAT